MHLKHRPTTLDELVGLDYIKKSLANFKFDVPVMFTGERGCGKTTLAEILANMFGASEQGIKTINCGYYRKIQDMRDEITKLDMTSLFSSKKVLILDEIHRLTKDSYSAWLTPLEKLSDRILVLACTTEPEAIPEPLLERFRVYRVNPLNQKEARLLIEQVLEKEGLDIPKWVKVKIIEQSYGIPRNILTALPKVIDITNEDEVDRLLEIVAMGDDSEALDIMKCIINRTGWGAVKNALNTALKDNAPENLRVALMNLIGGRMMSNYSQPPELDRLSKFHRSLQLAEGFPEKANLIVAVFKATRDFTN